MKTGSSERKVKGRCSSKVEKALKSIDFLIDFCIDFLTVLNPSWGPGPTQGHVGHFLGQNEAR